MRDFLSRLLAYSPSLIWRWIALVPDLDVTALLFRGEVVGATIGFYFQAENIYLTHVTAANRSLQGGGIGLFLRRMQLQQLAPRVGSTPLEVVSLSANPDPENRGAVHFQRYVLRKLGFEELQGALPIVLRIAAAKPELELARILDDQDVTPLRFRKLPEAGE